MQRRVKLSFWKKTFCLLAMAFFVVGTLALINNIAKASSYNSHQNILSIAPTDAIAAVTPVTPGPTTLPVATFSPGPNNPATNVTMPLTNMSSLGACLTVFGSNFLSILYNMNAGLVSYILCMLFQGLHWLAFTIFLGFSWIFALSIGIISLSPEAIAQISNIAGSASSNTANLTVILGNPAELLKLPAVTDVWKQCLNYTNAIVGIALLVVAFAEMLHLNLSTYAFKKIFPTLILAVVAANFSILFCRLIIDLSTVAASFVMQGGGGFMGSITNIFPDFQPAGITGIFGLTINLLYALLLSIEMAVLAIIFFFRRFFLMFLGAISPLVFLSMAIPQTKQYFTKWLDNFIKWSFAPVFSLGILWIGSAVLAVFPSGSLLLLLPKIAAAATTLWIAITSPFKLGAIGMSQMDKVYKDHAVNPVANRVSGDAKTIWKKFGANAPQEGGGLIGGLQRGAQKLQVAKASWDAHDKLNEEEQKIASKEMLFKSRVQVQHKPDGTLDRDDADNLIPLTTTHVDAPAVGPASTIPPDEETLPQQEGDTSPSSDVTINMPEPVLAITEGTAIAVPPIKAIESDNNPAHKNRDWVGSEMNLSDARNRTQDTAIPMPHTKAIEYDNNPANKNIDWSNSSINLPDPGNIDDITEGEFVENGPTGPAPMKALTYEKPSQSPTIWADANNPAPQPMKALGYNGNADYKEPGQTEQPGKTGGVIENANFEVKGKSTFSIAEANMEALSASQEGAKAAELKAAADKISQEQEELIEEGEESTNNSEASTTQDTPQTTPEEGAQSIIPASTEVATVEPDESRFRMLPPEVDIDLHEKEKLLALTYDGTTTPPEDAPEPENANGAGRQKLKRTNEGYQEIPKGNWWDVGRFAQRAADYLNITNVSNRTLEKEHQQKAHGEGIDDMTDALHDESLEDYRNSKGGEVGKAIDTGKAIVAALKRSSADAVDASKKNNEASISETRKLGDLIQAGNRLAAKKNLADQNLIAIQKERAELYRKTEDAKAFALSAEVQKKRIDKSDAYVAFADSDAKMNASSRQVQSLNDQGQMVAKDTSLDLSNAKVALKHETTLLEKQMERGTQKRETGQWNTDRGKEILQKISDEELKAKGFKATADALQSVAERRTLGAADYGMNPGADKRQQELADAALKIQQLDQKVKPVNQSLKDMYNEKSAYIINNDEDVDNGIYIDHSRITDPKEKQKAKDKNAQLGFEEEEENDDEKEKARKKLQREKRAAELALGRARTDYVRDVLNRNPRLDPLIDNSGVWDFNELAKLTANRVKKTSEKESEAAKVRRRTGDEENPNAYKNYIADQLALQERLGAVSSIASEASTENVKEFTAAQEKLAKVASANFLEEKERAKIRAEQEKSWGDLAVAQAERKGKADAKVALQSTEQNKNRIDAEKAYSLITENEAKLAATRGQQAKIKETELAKLRAQIADAETRQLKSKYDTEMRKENKKTTADVLRLEKKAFIANADSTDVKNAEELAFLTSTGEFGTDDDKAARADYFLSKATSNSLETSIKKETGIATGEISGDLANVAGVHNTLIAKNEIVDIIAKRKAGTLTPDEAEKKIRDNISRSQRLKNLRDKSATIEEFEKFINGPQWETVEKTMLDEIDALVQSKAKGAGSHFEKVLHIVGPDNNRHIDRNHTENRDRLEYRGVKGNVAFLPEDMTGEGLRRANDRVTERLLKDVNNSMLDDNRTDIEEGKIGQRLDEALDMIKRNKNSLISLARHEDNPAKYSKDNIMNYKQFIDNVMMAVQIATTASGPLTQYKTQAINTLIKITNSDNLNLQDSVVDAYKSAAADTIKNGGKIKQLTTFKEIAEALSTELTNNSSAEDKAAHAAAKIAFINVLPGGTGMGSKAFITN